MDVIIRTSTAADFDDILRVINDGASSYKGVIPEEAWKEPYFPESELR